MNSVYGPQWMEQIANRGLPLDEIQYAGDEDDESGGWDEGGEEEEAVERFCRQELVTSWQQSEPFDVIMLGGFSSHDLDGAKEYRHSKKC